MKNLFYIVYAFFLFLSVLGAQSETPDYEKLISPEDLKEDLRIARLNLEEVHTGLYSYTSKEKMDAHFDLIESQLTEPMTGYEFARLLCSLNTLIRNGHTDIDFPKAFVSAVQNDLPRFPLKLYRDKGEIYLLNNYSEEEALQQRDKILEINGESTSDLFEEFISMRNRDGYNTSLPDETVNRYFSMFYALYRGTPEKFQVKAENQSGEVKTYDLNALPTSKVREFRDKRYGKPVKSWYAAGTPALSLDIKENKTAVLTILIFSDEIIKKRGPKSKKFFQEAFEKIEAAGVENLIIDLRNNGGGEPKVSNELFAHLLDKPFTFYKETYVRTRKIPTPKYYKDSAKSYNLLSWILTKKKGENHYRLNLEGTKPFKPKGPIFKGQLYVLTNGFSFSQTGETVDFLKSETNAVFIGTEAGGSPTKNVSGVMMPLELPYSKTTVIVPAVMWEMNVNIPADGKGVHPDYEIKPSIGDMISGNDAVMKFALDLAGK